MSLGEALSFQLKMSRYFSGSCPHSYCAVLEEDGVDGVLKDDVVPRIALVELGLYFSIKVVVGVLGLPVATGHAQSVGDGAVGLVTP